MDYRPLGRTGLEVSALGFGCGAVGGLLVRGDRSEMQRTVARAMELGVNYFDTAALYGDGQSEINLGWVLQELGAEVLVGTKVELQPDELADIEQAVIASVHNSLRRLRRDYVDLIQLHNSVAGQRRPERRWLSVEDVDVALSAFQRLQKEGKVGFWGINGLGETEAIHAALTGDLHTVQSCYNLINPTAGMAAPTGFLFQDYGQLIDEAAARQVGVIAIRVLAAGALSGSAARHANAAQSVAPIASSVTFADDVAMAQRFNFLVDDGYAGSLVEAAIRFVIGKPEVSTALVGISTLAQLEQAVAAADKGALPDEALDRIAAIWKS